MTEREIWDTIGKNDPFCGTGGPTRAVPRIGRFARLDTALPSMISNNSLVLDIGCGYGRNSVPLQSRNNNIIACDWSLTMSRMVREAKVPFVMCDARRLPFRDNSVDCLICSHVLQHLQRKDLDRVLAEFERVAKQSLIIMPNPVGAASFFGLKPLFHALVMARGRSGRRIFVDIPTLRGYIVNYYLPSTFSTIVRRFFHSVKITPGNSGEKFPTYVTSSLLYICS